MRLHIFFCFVFILLETWLLVPTTWRIYTQEEPRLQSAQLCLEFNRRVRMLRSLHVHAPKFQTANELAAVRAKLSALVPASPSLQKLQAIEPWQELYSGQSNCAFLETLWQEQVTVATQQPELGKRAAWYAAFAKAATVSLDPFSNYEHFSRAEQLSVPLHASRRILGMIALEREEGMLINRVLPFSAVEKEGTLRAGDLLTGIEWGGNLHTYVPGNVNQFKELLQHEGNIVLHARRHEGEHVAQLRVVIPQDDTQAPRVFHYVTKNAGKKIGVIRVPSFYVAYDQRHADGSFAGVAEDLQRSLLSVQQEHVDGVFLDFRGNLGGDKDEARRIIGYFIGKGPAFRVRVEQGRQEIAYLALTDKIYSGPLVVLVDRNSASASELVAGALRDAGRAAIYGDRTYGKWTLQSIFLLPGFGMEEFSGRLRITVGETMTPRGLRYPGTGLPPDKQFTTVTGQPGTVADDLQLRDALETFAASI